jgi:hypothetical protein
MASNGKKGNGSGANGGNGSARPRTRVEGKILSRSDAYKRALSLSEVAFDQLEHLIENGDARAQVDAARVLINALGHLAPAKDEPLIPPEMTPQEQAARLAAAEQSPAVREYLKSKGWKAPEAN